MTDDELWRVRCLIAEARAASANRHADFMAGYGDLICQLRDFWEANAPPDTHIPDELVERIEAFKERWK